MDVLAVVAVYCVGIVGGYIGGWRARSKRAAPKLMCGCGHHLSYHEPTADGPAGRCHFRHGEHYGAAECGCQRYLGPQWYDDVVVLAD